MRGDGANIRLPPERKPELECIMGAETRPGAGPLCELPLFPWRFPAWAERARAALTIKARKRTLWVFIRWGSSDWTLSVIEPFNQSFVAAAFASISDVPGWRINEWSERGKRHGRRRREVAVERSGSRGTRRNRLGTWAKPLRPQLFNTSTGFVPLTINE